MLIAQASVVCAAFRFLVMLFHCPLQYESCASANCRRRVLTQTSEVGP